MNLSRSIICSVCKRKAIIASGFNAQAMDRVRVALCAMALNWQAAPTFKCPECRDDKVFVWFRCSNCGVSEAIYSTERPKQFEILKAKGWEVVPKIRCADCIKYQNFK